MGGASARALASPLTICITNVMRWSHWRGLRGSMSFLFGITLYSFPKDALTNHRMLSGSKQQKFMVSPLGRLRIPSSLSQRPGRVPPCLSLPPGFLQSWRLWACGCLTPAMWLSSCHLGSGYICPSVSVSKLPLFLGTPVILD